MTTAVMDGPPCCCAMTGESFSISLSLTPVYKRTFKPQIVQMLRLHVLMELLLYFKCVSDYPSLIFMTFIIFKALIAFVSNSSVLDVLSFRADGAIALEYEHSANHNGEACSTIRTVH